MMIHPTSGLAQHRSRQRNAEAKTMARELPLAMQTRLSTGRRQHLQFDLERLLGAGAGVAELEAQVVRTGR